ncbi:MAG: hypothetical protein CL862_02620 [Cyanobium sp. NAT70]|nr:hypothetical protein [Cyanobium sp. NAT70]
MSLEFFFSFVGAATGSLLLFVGVAATEFAVILGLLNVEIYVTVRIEGRSLRFKLTNQSLNTWDAICCSGPLVCL